MKDLAQDLAEDELGPAKDGGVKVLIVKVLMLSIAICQLRPHAQHTRSNASRRCLSCPSSSASGGTHATLTLRWHVKDEHVKDGHMKDAAQDVAVAQDVAEDVLGAAEDGSEKVFIVARITFHRPQLFTWATREGRCGGRCGRRCGGRAAEFGAGSGLRGPGGARPPRLATTAAAAAVFVQLTLSSRLAEMRAQLGSSVAFGSGCEQALLGVPRRILRRSLRRQVAKEGPGLSGGEVPPVAPGRELRVEIRREEPVDPLRRLHGFIQLLHGQGLGHLAGPQVFNAPPQWGIGSRQQKQRLRAPRRRSRPPSRGGC